MRRSRHWDERIPNSELRHIEPTAVLWRVMPFEPFGQPPCFGGGKSFVKRSLGVGVEIVLHQNNFLGVQGPCHAASGLRFRWRFGSQGDEENQLSRLPLSARDHPADPMRGSCPRYCRMALLGHILEPMMETVADRAKPTAIRTDLRAIFVSLELSRSRWLITSLSPGNRDKMSKHSVQAGDIAGMLARFPSSETRRRHERDRVFRLSSSKRLGLIDSGSIACFGRKKSKAMSLIQLQSQHRAGVVERRQTGSTVRL